MDKLGLIDRHVNGDLKRFKKFIEECGTEDRAGHADV